MTTTRALLTTAIATIALPASVLVAPVASAAPDDGVSERGSRTVTIRGHGYGHGRGLSQYGAERAARQGRSHRQILGFYYPRTRIGTARGGIRILITGDTGADLVVRDRSRLRARSLGSDTSWRLREPAARRWRITPTRDNSRSVIAWKARRWHHWRTVAGAAQFSAGGAPVKLLAEAGARRYRGALRSVPRGRGGRITVNALPLEAYLRGVVPVEVPALWEPAAVRAQAVAARTYAAFERRSGTGPYDLCDTTSCQVYGGAGAEHPASDAAIRRTARQVVTRRGRPIFSQFSASSGGWTADGGRPYLRAKRDPYDDWRGNPYHLWRTTVSAATIENQWPGIGRLRRIRVLRRDGHGDWNGRILRLRLVGGAGRVEMSGDDFRFALGLRSTWLRITTDL